MILMFVESTHSALNSLLWLVFLNPCFIYLFILRKDTLHIGKFIYPKPNFGAIEYEEENFHKIAQLSPPFCFFWDLIYQICLQY